MAKVSQEYIDILLKEKATYTGIYNEIRSMEYIMEGYRVLSILRCSSCALGRSCEPGTPES
jgi:hypothetical protein